MEVVWSGVGEGEEAPRHPQETKMRCRCCGACCGAVSHPPCTKVHLPGFRRSTFHTPSILYSCSACSYSAAIVRGICLCVRRAPAFICAWRHVFYQEIQIAAAQQLEGRSSPARERFRVIRTIPAPGIYLELREPAERVVPSPAPIHSCTVYACAPVIG